ncbi:MAG: TonB-dependent receptor [Bacteroidetes bacterium]|jgi:outer membrane receptor protein involved in Fe transport|nr:TonB-dependent receptor [Bacteroidota bacterium]
MTHRYITSGVLLLLIFLSSAVAANAQEGQAQEGQIAGVVVDAEQGEPLIGATVRVVDTEKGVATDLDGRYRLTGLAPGQYDLRISYVGFQPKVVEGVEVTAGETTRLDIDLREDAQALDEVVVTAQAARDSEAGLLRQRQRANGVSDAISAEAIGRAGAGNAADALEKVTGASVIDGKFVNMRGLQGRYVNAQLNGTNLPSADPDGNSVALDLFPSSLIDNIIATKTFTPDRAGNFTGGSIDISTKAIPDDFFFTLSLSSSVNSEIGVSGNVLHPGGGLSAVPTAANAEGLPRNLAQAFNDDARAEQLNDLTQAFATTIQPEERPMTVGDRSGELAIGNRFEVLGGRTLGVIFSASYDRSFRGFSGATTARFQQTGLESATLTPTARFSTQRGTDETLYGGLLGVAFQLTPRHELGARLLYNASAEDEARFESGSLPRDLSGDQVFQTRALRTTERSVQSGELKGTHQLGTQPSIRLTWSASLAQTTRDDPDYRFFANQTSTRNGNTTFGISRSIYQAPTRYFRTLDEQDVGGTLNLEVPLGSVRLKAGGQANLRSRTFRERRFEHLDDQTTYEGDPDRYISDQAGFAGEDDRGRNRFGTYVLDRTQPSNNYDGSQDVLAGYAMAEFPIPGLSRLEFVGGLRVEQTDMSIETIDGGRTGSFTETDLLPSANLIWSLRDDMNVRTAYGRTIARPSFREFAPFNSFNFIGDYIEVGNPELRRTRIHNLDVRWEWFMRGGELLSVGAFYKSFDDPIERSIDTRAAGADVVIQYTNKDNAQVYGAEFEARKRLDGIAHALRHVQVGANLTLIESEVNRSADELEAIRAFDDNPETTRALQGQSPYIVNLNLGYENPELGTSINVFFNRFGDRLHTVTRNGLDLFEQGRSALDITASQRVLRQFTIKGSIKNLLDTDWTTAQEFQGRTFINDRQPLGRTISLGLSYQL